MRMIVLSLAFTSTVVFAQAPAQPPTGGPTFEVVSIRRNTSGALGSNGSSERPDGGFSLINIPIMTLIGRSYSVPPIAPIDMVGLPEWAQRDRYDVRATSPLSRSATADERAAMLRAMLADRFMLAAHVEKREQPAFDLVLARSDGRLGSGMKPSEIDCVAQSSGRPRGGRSSAGGGNASRRGPQFPT